MAITLIKITPQKSDAIKKFLRRAGQHLIYFAITEFKSWFFHRFIQNNQCSVAHEQPGESKRLLS